MADKVIRIEGHTDSAGSDAYNQRLSYRRAVAVQQYLADAHGLPRARLPVLGKGLGRQKSWENFPKKKFF